MSAINFILIILMQLALILALSRIMGWIFGYFRQPQVMGEMIAGIMLGPSVFGLVAPGFAQMVFPAESIPYLSILSQLGVIFFLFLIGLELDPKLLKNRGHTAVVVSHASIIVPFLLGAGLTLYLYPRLFNDTSRMVFTSAALFMGAAMSITAFPVLARILTERNLHKTNIGAIAITCAAVDDVTAWCMLAFVVGIARADGLGPGIKTAVLAIAYVTFMFFVVRPFLRRIEAMYARRGRITQNVVALIFLLILLSAFITEAIGIHALFGAFLMGAMMPKGTQFVRALSEKLEDYTVVLLLPIFFAYTGLRTQIGLLNNGELWFDTFLIIAVACTGKFGGSALAGRACGLGWREASTIGILMNTRGLMELVILNIGLQEGVVTNAVFAMMVIMALVTTALTTPILHYFTPMQRPSDAAMAKERHGFTVLVPISLPDSGPALARLAGMLIGSGTINGRVLALHLRRPADHEAYRSALDEVVETPLAPLTPLMAEATKQKLPVEPISFVTRDAAADIAAVAQARYVDLVLMGFHKPVFSKTILGGTVRGVLNNSESDVAIFVDRGFDDARRIVVPFRGSEHDRLALELAARMARSISIQVTILHIVDPRGGDRVDAQALVDQQFQEIAPTQFQLKIVEARLPIHALLAETTRSDLLLVGLSETWGLALRRVGLRPERIVADCPGSLLIVHKSANVRLTPSQDTPTASATPIARA